MTGELAHAMKHHVPAILAIALIVAAVWAFLGLVAATLGTRVPVAERGGSGTVRVDGAHEAP